MIDPQIEAALERVQKGAVDDYALVVHACQRRLRAWLSALCPPSIDPQEIAHRAFLEAYRQIDRYQLGTNFQSWLNLFARNLLLAELKRLQRQEKNAANYLEHLLVEHMIQEAEHPTEEQEQRLRALRSCQEQLSEPSRLLLQQRYTENAPLEKIARHIGKTVAAVKFQLFAVRRKLRDCVEKKLSLERYLPQPLSHPETN